MEDGRTDVHGWGKRDDLMYREGKTIVTLNPVELLFHLPIMMF